MEFATGVIDLLFDNVPTVASRAMQCVPVFCQRLSAPSLQKVLERLAKLASQVSSTIENRDVSHQVLVNIIQVLDESLGQVVCGATATIVLAGLHVEAANPPTLEMLAVLEALLDRYGTSLGRDFQAIQSVLFSFALSRVTSNSGKAYNQVKLAISCLGHFARVVPEAIFDQTVEQLLQAASEESHPFSLKVRIQALGSVGRAVGHRLGRWMGRVIPLIVATVDDPRFEDDHELKDNCIKTLTSLVSESRDIAPFLEDPLLNLALRFVSFDPNYVPLADDDAFATSGAGDGGAGDGAGDDADDWGTGDGVGDDDWGSGDGHDDEEFALDADPDDISWRVRKAAASLILALATTSVELLPVIYAKVVPQLIARFEERNDHVRLEAFAAFLEIIRQTSSDRAPGGCHTSLRGTVADLTPRLISILKNAKSSVQIRTAAIQTFSALTTVDTNMFSQPQIDLLLPEVLALLQQEVVAAFKTTLLDLICRLLQRSPSSSFFSHADRISSALRAILRSKHSKQAIPQGLRTALQFLSLHRTSSFSSSSSSSSSTSFPSYMKRLSGSIKKKMEAADVDQEVKELSIEWIGNFLSIYGQTAPGYSRLVDLVIDRLRSEITRHAAVKALELIGHSDIPLSSEQALHSIELATDFLRKNSRPLRISSLRALPLVLRKAEGLPPTVLSTLLVEASRLLDVQDLQLCHLSLQVSAAVIPLPISREVQTKVVDTTLPRALALVTSPLVQGQALQSLIDLFSAIVRHQLRTFEELLEVLLSITSRVPPEMVKRPSLNSIAVCIATAAQHATDKQFQTTITSFLDHIRAGSRAAPALVLISLMCIGEIGRLRELSAWSTLISLLSHHFDNPFDEHKHSAATALGQVCVGSHTFLTQLLEQVKSNESHRYSYLQSLREVLANGKSLSAASVALLSAFSDTLIAMSNIADEGLRNLFADCLGKLAVLDAAALVPKLFGHAKSEHPFLRAAMVSSFKSLAAEADSLAVDSLLRESILVFWEVLNDSHLAPQKAALLSLTYAAHRRPVLVQPHLALIQPLLYRLCPKNKELVRIVEYGPYKNEVDDGLPVRKAAFECMSMLLEHFVDHLDLSAYLRYLAFGLEDPCPEIKMLCHLILASLAAIPSAAPFLLGILPALLSPLRETLAREGREADVKQDQERHEEQIRSALRAIASIHRNLPAAAASVPAFRDLVTAIRQGSSAAIFHAILSGSSSETSAASSSSSASSSS